MKKVIEKKMYYYVDESGDTTFFNKRGKNLLNSGDVSRVFIVGYLETEEPNKIHKELEKIRNEIRGDEYLKSIPSVKKSLLHFHAKDDCPEVREKVFKAIKNMDIKVFIIVLRKNVEIFQKKFNCNKKKMYEYAVEKLFENRLHLYSETDIYFSKMGNIVRENNMKEALKKAEESFSKKWNTHNKNKIRTLIQEPSQVTLLQVIDYVIWTINRVYEKNDSRYYNFIKEKISLIIDIFDKDKYPNIYYDNKKNVFDIKKISPVK